MGPPGPTVLDPAGPIVVDADRYTITGTARPGSLVRAWVDSDRDGRRDAGEAVAGSQRLKAGRKAFAVDVPLAQDRANHFVVTDARPILFPDLTESRATPVPTILEESLTLGPAGGTVRIDDPRDPLYGAELTAAPGVLAQRVTFRLSPLSEAELTAALGEGLPADDRFRGGVTIETDPVVAIDGAIEVSLPSAGGAAPGDQLLVGQVVPVDPGEPAALVYRGLATLGSLKFSVRALGVYAIVSPASPLIVANGRYVDVAGAPVEAGIVQSTAQPLFRALTDAAGAFSIPAGVPGDYTLFVARTATPPAGWAVLGTGLPGNFPIGGFINLVEDLVRDRLDLKDKDVLRPCKPPPPGGFITSSDQPDAQQNGEFRLVADGPAIDTDVSVPGALVLSDPAPGQEKPPKNFFKLFTGGLITLLEKTTARFATEDGTIAQVHQTNGILRGVNRGATTESAVVSYVKFEQSFLGLRPCVGQIAAFMPVDVKPPLEIIGQPRTGEVGVPYLDQLSAFGGWPFNGAFYEWAMPEPSTMPGGLELLPTGDITGTPTTDGTFTPQVTVRDGNTPATETTAPVTLEIVPRVEITTPSLPVGQVNTPYSAPVASTGGLEPYEWGIEGDLPDGLELTSNNESAEIHGTPTTAGTATFTLAIKDSLDAVARRNFTLTVADEDGGGDGGGGGDGDPPPPDPDPDPEPGPGPPPPPDPVGGSYGDPHLWTVDGIAYEFHAAGEYVFARSAGAGLAIHARFGRSSPFAWVSFNRGLAVRDGTDLVTFSDATSLEIVHEAPARVNGSLVSVDALPLRLPAGGRLEAIGDLYRLTTRGGTVVEVSRGGYPRYVVRPAASLRGALEGLLGNFDGDYTNDIGGDLYGSFAERWEVPPGNSLFTTTLPDTELTPIDQLFPIDLSQFPADAIAAALATCRAAGVDASMLEDCALDVLFTGNPAAAAASAAAVANLAVGTFDRDAPPAAQRLSGAVGVPVLATVPANATLEIAVPVEANRAFRLDAGPGCTPSPLVATIETPGTNTVATVDVGSCADDRIFGTGPHGGDLIVTLRALGTDVPATFAVVYTDTHIANGSFELPVIESPYLTLGVGETIGPWRVTAGEVDIQFTWAAAQHGRQSVDMSGFVGGKICQSFATATGATYDVSFWMSHNAVGVTSASLSASITGITSLPFTHNADSTNADPRWEQHMFSFTAAGSSSELCFESTDPPVGSGPDGAAMLDNVTVTRR